MKISCCIFDLDGTLLTSQKKISDIDKATLKRLSERGIKIIIATGRSDLQIFEYVHDLGIADPVITCNGGQIINMLTKEVLHRKFLPANDAKAILNSLIMEGKDYLFYTPDYVYHAVDSTRIKLFQNYNKTIPEVFRVPIRSVTEYPSEEGYNNILKILIRHDTAIMPDLEERFNQNHTLTLVSSGAELIDIMPENTSKGSGIKILTEKLGIPLSETVAFGDSMNDAEMLRTAGYSVAMGNAIDPIKHICDFVTKTNDEFGITYALEQLLK